MLRYLGLRQAGGTQAHIARMSKRLEIDVSHFTGQVHNKGKVALNRKTPDEVLIILPEGRNRTKTVQLRRAMLEKGVSEACECGLTTDWQGAKLVLEIDHINGNWLDNRLENLRFICPNCHSQCESTNVPHKYK